MKALILAAGRGSRFEKLSEEKPKCMYEFAEKTLIQWQIDSLKGYVDKIGVVVGYKSEIINNAEITKIMNSNWMNSNMISSLFCAAEWIGEDECIISYSDIVYSKNLIKVLKKSKAKLALVYNTRFRKLWVERFENPLEDLESFKIKDGYVLEIGGKVENLDDVEGQYMGLIKFGKTELAKFLLYLTNKFEKTQIDKLDFTESLSNYIKDGGKVVGIPTQEMWLEFDTVSDVKLYKKYEADFATFLLKG